MSECERRAAAGEPVHRKTKAAWAIVTVQGILDNDFYIGTLRQGKFTRVKINGTDRKLDESEHRVFEHHHQEIIDYLKKNEDSANSFMNAIQSKITNRLASVGIHGSIYGRIKHTYSIYRKMRAQNKTIDELYDLYAFRVIVDNIADCYNVLGHIHDLFNPIPGRFKDYISTPKPNMYQSLHTTVIGSQGIPFEVQIRTWEMHQTAEYGVAAHWKYKQHAGDGSEKEFEWVRRLLENQQDVEADDYIPFAQGRYVRR